MPKDVQPEYFNSIDGTAIQTALRIAQGKFWANDRELLRNDANERTLCGRFAFYLVPGFSRFDVDIEYNRNHAERDYRKKIWDREAIRLLLESRGLSTPERRARAEHDGLIVLPDIIVHIRDRPINLLIIEAKKSSSRLPESVDREKLRALSAELNYRYSVFLRFPIGDRADADGDWFALQ